MRSIENQIYHGKHSGRASFLEELSWRLRGRSPPCTYGDIHFRACDFQGCGFACGITKVEWRPIVRNVHLENCLARSCAIGPAIVDDVVIDDLRVPTHPLFIDGAAFRHVMLRGSIGAIKVRRYADSNSILRSEHQNPFDQANREFYQAVDWAIDITQGEFRDLMILNVPSRLIRRHLDTQVLLVRDRVEGMDFTQLALSDSTYWQCIVEMYLAESTEDAFVVVPPPRKHSHYHSYFRDIAILRDHGLII